MLAPPGKRRIMAITSPGSLPVPEDEPTPKRRAASYDGLRGKEAAQGDPGAMSDHSRLKRLEAQQELDQATAAQTIQELEAEILILERLEEQAKQVVHSGQDRKWDELSKLLQNTTQPHRQCFVPYEQT